MIQDKTTDNLIDQTRKLETKPIKSTQDQPILSIQDVYRTKDDERNESLAAAIASFNGDVSILPDIIKYMLDHCDVRIVMGHIKTGFEKELSAMQQQHATLQSTLQSKVDDGSMHQSEMLMRTQNSFAKIVLIQSIIANIPTLA